MSLPTLSIKRKAAPILLFEMPRQANMQVLGKPAGGVTRPITYANRTQAQRAALLYGGEVLHFGVPFYVRIGRIHVRGARGHERYDGGIVYAGDLYYDNELVAHFSNAGDGGCTRFQWKSGPYRPLIEARAAVMCPEVQYEQLDQYVGQLWDEAFTRGNT